MDHEQIDNDSDERVAESAADVDLLDAGDEVIPAAATSRRRLPLRRPSLLALVAGILAALVVAALVVSALQWSSLSSQKSLRQSALKDASTYGVYLSSYDYKNLDGPTAPWTQVDHHSTPSFRKDFDSTRANLRSLVTDYKATANGKVISAGLSSVSSSRAVVLLFIDQTVTNTAQKPGTTTQPLRVQLVMLHQNGRWLIDKLEVPK